MKTDVRKEAPKKGLDPNDVQLSMIALALVGMGIYYKFWHPLSEADRLLVKWMVVSVVLSVVFIAAVAHRFYFSSWAKKRAEDWTRISWIPRCLKVPSPRSSYLGMEKELGIPIYLPDSIRSRHVHVLGATGSGKTESVVLALCRQDARRGPLVIVDAKGDKSFLDALEELNLGERLQVFDLGNPASPCLYNPLGSGSSMEAAGRLFASLEWSETYYKLKAQSALLRFFETHALRNKALGENVKPSLFDLSQGFESSTSLTQILSLDPDRPVTITKEGFAELAGLKAQLDILSSGHFATILSESPGEKRPVIVLEDAIREGKVVYFRLQALRDPQAASILGRLIINDLAYCAAKAHALGQKASSFCPVFLDEFGSLVCDGFLELISKARSAGFALHFSHQSAADLGGIQDPYLSRVLDNASTKIVMRIYDPQSAELLAKCFGTREEVKVTHRVESDGDDVEYRPEGSLREVQAFRVNPNRMKFMPTGEGVMFTAHGEDTPDGAACVFHLKFPFTDKAVASSQQKGTSE
jgi:hypothetical protein